MFVWKCTRSDLKIKFFLRKHVPHPLNWPCDYTHGWGLHHPLLNTYFAPHCQPFWIQYYSMISALIFLILVLVTLVMLSCLNFIVPLMIIFISWDVHSHKEDILVMEMDIFLYIAVSVCVSMYMCVCMCVCVYICVCAENIYISVTIHYSNYSVVSYLNYSSSIVVLTVIIVLVNSTPQ